MTIPTGICSILPLNIFLGFPTGRILAQCGAIDNPNARSSHSLPIVRGGGIAIMAAFAVAGISLSLLNDPQPMGGVLLSALAVAVISFMDDLRSLATIVRFSCHCAAAVCAML